ncbi:tRNA-specific 2-thiouridylase MnmA [Dirofilaria immitis]
MMLYFIVSTKLNSCSLSYIRYVNKGIVKCGAHDSYWNKLTSLTISNLKKNLGDRISVNLLLMWDVLHFGCFKSVLEIFQKIKVRCF